MSVIFDQLRISDDGSKLFIDIHVNKASYFQGYTIKKLTITTSEYVPESESMSSISNFIYQRTFAQPIGGTVTEASIMLQKSDLDKAYDAWILWDKGKIPPKPLIIANTNFTGNFSGPLFFVIVETEPTSGADENLPCTLDGPTVGVTFDENLLYQRVMDFTKSLADDCNVPTGFTDFILLWNAFKASIETDHWVSAKKYWEMLFGEGSHMVTAYSTTKPCGCHG